MSKLRLLVVDDTIVYRKIVSDILAELPDIEVVGTAANGKIALTKIAALKPDLITLDIEMPEMNGLEVLAHLRDQNLQVGAIEGIHGHSLNEIACLCLENNAPCEGERWSILSEANATRLQACQAERACRVSSAVLM